MGGSKGSGDASELRDRKEAGSSAPRPPRRPVRKLKPGPGLAPAVVVADQQRRLRRAMVALAADEGFERVTVRALTKEAGVSTRTFYRHFANAADCLGATCESTMSVAIRGMEEARSSAVDWEAGLRTAVAFLMGHFANQPDDSSVALIEAFAGGSSVLARRKAMTGTLERQFADQLRAASLPAAVRRLLAGGMVAGALRVATTTTIAGQTDHLPGLAAPLGDWMLSIISAPCAKESAPFSLPPSEPHRRREPTPFPDESSAESSVSVGDERERVYRACLKLAAAGGLSDLTIPRIRSAAEVSRRSFDSHFSTLNECFLESVEWLARLAAARAESWVETDPDPDRRTQRFVLALCAQAARNGALANLVFAGILEAGRAGFFRRERLVSAAAAGIREQLKSLATTDDLPLEASAAAAWELAHAEVTAGKAKRLPSLSPMIAHLVLTPVRTQETTSS